jgi:hypothetical protein
VLGGAGVVMFGRVAATGVRILGAADFRHNRNNLFIVAIALGAGLIPSSRRISSRTSMRGSNLSSARRDCQSGAGYPLHELISETLED